MIQRFALFAACVIGSSTVACSSLTRPDDLQIVAEPPSSPAAARQPAPAPQPARQHAPEAGGAARRPMPEAPSGCGQ